MPPRRQALVTALQVADLAVVAVSFTLAIAAASGGWTVDSWPAVLEMRVKLTNAVFMGAYLTAWHVVLKSRGLYGSYRLAAFHRELRDLACAVAIAVGVLVPLGVVLRFQYASVAFFVAFAATSLAGLGLSRWVVRVIARDVRRLGRNLREAILVHQGSAGIDVAGLLAAREELGYRVAAVVELNRAGEPVGGGSAAEAIEAVLERQPIDEVFLSLAFDREQPLVRTLIGICEERGLTVRLVASMSVHEWGRTAVDTLGDLPVLTVYSGPPPSLALVVKRGVDLLGAAAALVVLSPVFAVVALVLKWHAPGPVFFAQERVGLNGRRFRAYKFRTMVEGAELQQAALENQNEAAGPVFKIRDDPRVTRVGRWLRRTSLDELPQLWNVLVGQMSLVGPRPLPVRDASRMDVRWHKRRFSVRPGITCLWQVYSREPQFEEWARLDMEYIDNWSLGLDLKILALTVPAVLSGQGAH